MALFIMYYYCEVLLLLILHLVKLLLSTQSLSWLCQYKVPFCPRCFCSSSLFKLPDTHYDLTNFLLYFFFFFFFFFPLHSRLSSPIPFSTASCAVRHTYIHTSLRHSLIFFRWTDSDNLNSHFPYQHVCRGEPASS